jgi:nucleotide-binding universal stress UspA family protein
MREDLVRPLSRILCAVNIDDHARTTFAQALAIARARAAKLLLVCAVPPAETFNQRATERVGYLMRLRREAEAAGVDVHTSVQRGDTREVILRHAAARQADLIVIGVEHGRAQGVAWGALAEDVLRSAPCPTLVVPAGATEQASFVRMLSAVPVEPFSSPSFDAMVPLASPSGAHWALLHVAGSQAAAGAAMARLQAMIPNTFTAVAMGRVVVGPVVKEVLKAARAMQADLLVIGARPRHRVGRRLFGVTRQLLTRSACPVLAIPVERVAAARVDPQAA